MAKRYKPAPERVALGAALLDQRIPTWAHQLDLEKLNLGDPCRCVLGQLGGGYTLGLKMLWPVENREPTGPDYAMDPKAQSLATSHGFDGAAVKDTDYLKDAYQELTELWREEVLARRLAV